MLQGLISIWLTTRVQTKYEKREGDDYLTIDFFLKGWF